MSDSDPAEEPSRPAALPIRTMPDWAGPSTRLLHGTHRLDWNAGALVRPIYQTSTYRYPEEFSEARGIGRVHLYTRMSNPTFEPIEDRLRLLEGAEAVRLFGSGMGAISTSLLALLGSGDEVVTLRDLYGGTLDLFTDLLPRFGVRVRWLNSDQAQEPEAALRPTTRLVFLETPTNPLLRVHDLRRWAEAAHGVGAILVVDNTLATPVNQRPLALGADLVLHSATKYLGGHSDLLAGVVAGSEALLDRVDPHFSVGSVLDPFAAFLLDRGLKTLALRVERQNQNGRRVAESLARHGGVERVDYPGFASDREEEIALRQMRGRGGVVSITFRGGVRAARGVLRRLRFVEVASSLGGVESLASVPRETSHRHLTADELRERGIGEGLVRFAFGVEDTEDLIRDLTEAIELEADSLAH